LWESHRYNRRPLVMDRMDNRIGQSILSITDRIRNRYDRLSPYYNLLESFLEKVAFSKWRKRAFDYLEGENILEVGVGTGKNLDFYPPEKRWTAIDFSPGMLNKAKIKLEKKRINVDLIEMDVQELQFEDQSFDTVLATFVFCSVPDPIKGLKEIKRVCKKGGKIILLEHVRPSGRLLGRLFDAFNPFIVKLMGVNINRETVANIKKAGLKIEKERSLFNNIVKMVVVSA
jgi:ubiquinone/menaquinone biosynthesis C-methylase UbiE